MENLPTRQNNPGDIRDTKTGSYKTYSSPEEGFNALKNDLTIKMSGKSKTGITPQSSLVDFSKVWAPASDKNDPIKYGTDLAKQLGVPENTPIGSLQNRLDDFANAIAKNEGFHGEQVKGMEENAQLEQPLTDNNQTKKPILSHSQLIANINAMEKQGATKEEVQGYLDNLKSDTSNGENNLNDNSSQIKDTIVGGDTKDTAVTDKRQKMIEEGQPVAVNQNKVEPTVAGKVIRGLITPFVKVAASGKNLVQAIEGKPETDIKNNYLGDVPRVGKDFNVTKGLTKENVGAVGDAVKTGVQIAGTIEGAKGLTKLTTGLLSKASLLKDPEIVEILNNATGKGTVANMSRQQAIDALGNALKEQTVSESGGALEQKILTALKQLNPTLQEKKTLSSKVLKLLGGAVRTAIGGTIMGEAIKKGEQVAGLFK